MKPPLRALEERLLPPMMGGCLILFGAAVAIAWWTGNAAWMQLRPDWVPVQGNAALGFLLCGTGLLALHRGARRLALVVAAAIIAGALVTLGQYLLDVDVGIDRMLFKPAVFVSTSPPGRMAPNTAVAFLLAGLALLALRRRAFPGALLGCLVLTLGGVGLVGYMANVPAAFAWGRFTHMAFYTALAFVLLGFGLVALARGRHRLEDNSRLHWSSLLAATVVAVASVLFWQALRTQEAYQTHLTTDAQARAVDAEITARLESITTALTLLAERGAAAGWRSLEDWRQDAQLSVAGFAGFVMIEWIDQDFVPRVFVAHEPTPRPLVIDAAGGLFQEALESVSITRGPVVAAPFAFADGTIAIRVIVPLSSPTRPPAYLSAVFAADAFFETLPRNVAPGYALRVSYRNREIFRHGAIGLVDQGDWVRAHALHPPGPTLWQLLIAPQAERLDAQLTALPEVVLSAGLLIALLLGLTLWLGERATLRARHFETAVRERTAELEAEVTVRQRAEADLLYKSEQLAEADRRKDAFLLMLGHELRNPLGAIRNAVEVLDARPNTATDEAMRGIVRRQVEHLARLVDDLLDLSRIERGKLAVRRSRLDLVALVTEVVESERMPIEAAGLTLETGLPAPPLWVEADPTRLAQVIDNLLSNARKFTSAGGTIRIQFAAGGNGQIRVAVQDTGCGIDPEDLPEVFVPFRRGSAALDRESGGLGLGLPLARELIRVHGGEMTVASAGRDRGTEVAFTLPLAEPPPSVPASVRPEAGTGSRRRVLVVDDQRDSAESLAELLRAFGHQVEVAYDGPMALQTAARFTPQVVICDIGLPGMDGYRVAQTLRRQPQTAMARLLALTGFGDAEAVHQSHEAGFDHHLTKPVNPLRLRELIMAAESPDDKSLVKVANR